MSVLPPKLTRYAALANLFIKYGTRISSTEATRKDAETFTADLEKLGPTFVKLGQLLSTRADLLPPVYLEALSRLQDDVAPVSAADVYQTIEEDLHVKVSNAFLSFDEEPLASASLGQVHRATLRDGRSVVVKVQRPGITAQVEKDLEALDEIASFVDQHTATGRRYEFAPMVREFRKAITAELDYKQEASHLRALGRNLAAFRRIIVPSPIDDYVSRRVLTMTEITGTKVTAVNPVTLVDVDPQGLADELIHAYLHQILIDGFFHADPHPGNVLVTPEGNLALIDLGMTGHLSPSLQDSLLKLVLAVSEGRGEEAAHATISLGEMREDFDEKGFTRDVVDLVGHYHDASLAELQLGRIVIEINQSAGARGIKAPVELTMLGKTLLNVDQVARCLAPSLDVNAAIRQHAASLMQRRLLKGLSPGNVFSTVLEAKEFAENLPRRINRVLESLASSQLKLKVEMIDEGAVMDGLQKVANRITLGLVLAALIVGAAMMRRIELFVVAGSIGAWLVIHILATDKGSRPPIYAKRKKGV